VEGLFRKPTIVNNVETFANLHAILSLGCKAYAGIGTAKSTGPKLISLDSHFVKPGIYEVAMGTPLRTVVDLAGGWKVPVKAIQVGGPLGGIVPMTHIDALTVDFESFKNAGFMPGHTGSGFLLGHAGVVSIPTAMPMIEYLGHLLKFTSDESCGKCFPCRIGTQRLTERLGGEAGPADFQSWEAEVHDISRTMMATSGCGLGTAAPAIPLSLLRYFPERVRARFDGAKR